VKRNLHTIPSWYGPHTKRYIIMFFSICPEMFSIWDGFFFYVHVTMNHWYILLSTTNKMHCYTVFFIIVNALHISGCFFAHHQDLKNCKHSIWCVPCLLAATTSVLEMEFHLNYTSLAASKLGTYQMLCVQFLCSWWWVEKPPKTCRALTVIKNIV